MSGMLRISLGDTLEVLDSFLRLSSFSALSFSLSFILFTGLFFFSVVLKKESRLHRASSSKPGRKNEPSLPGYFLVKDSSLVGFMELFDGGDLNPWEVYSKSIWS
eukprot:CAMPEP_0197013400 /NCGR_PEP_ID=MMETSP1380-20130617/66214_1 /TAXON_ID=5936 /ORGANISM="Euplotes crassus, Strain CT5" /LENGTH=104 /DNA_ID=CAMNT_0042437627 /DNA_START=22 /DNA_END=336 /DNA_ORIENTATION=+